MKILDFEKIWGGEWFKTCYCPEKRLAIHGMSILRNEPAKHFVRIFLRYKKKEFVFRIPKSQILRAGKRFYIKGVLKMSEAMGLNEGDFWVYVTKLAFDC